MYNVRFNLQRGPYYKFWQIRDWKDRQCAPSYVDPAKYQLTMVDCELVCNESKARKVYAAGVKDVCGWVQCRNVFCSDLSVFSPANTDEYPRLCFNPIVDTAWRLEGFPEENWNGRHVDTIITSGHRCYIDQDCLVA